MSKAVFAGTFDPFTIGHLDIVRRAAKLFDEVIILFAINSDKDRMFSQQRMIEAVQETIGRYDLKNVKVDSYDGFVVSYCEEHKVNCLIRGIRNQKDFSYEEEIAQINTLLNKNIETIFMRGRMLISSTAIKTLINAKKDIFPYVPVSVFRLIKEN